jgi:hypothetical protein
MPLQYGAATVQRLGIRDMVVPLLREELAAGVAGISSVALSADLGVVEGQEATESGPGDILCVLVPQVCAAPELG